MESVKLDIFWLNINIRKLMKEVKTWQRLVFWKFNNDELKHEKRHQKQESSNGVIRQSINSSKDECQKRRDQKPAKNSNLPELPLKSN